MLYKFVSPNRTNTTELPRKPAGVFFRWETPREPIAVHFHLNVVDLLEGDFIRRGETGVAGFLLGQIEHSRTPTLIVEDYESTPNVARLDTSDSAFGDRHLLEEMVDRWHPRPEKRISILGFYRSCPQGQVSLNSDDLEISSAHPIEPERIFLLIEPQVGNASRELFAWSEMVPSRGSGIRFLSTVRNLPKEEPRVSHRFPACKALLHSYRKSWFLKNRTPVSSPRNSLKLHTGYAAGFGIVTTLATVAAGIIPLRSTQVFRALSGTFKASEEPAALGLKLQHIESDWQLSWDPTAPFLLKAAAGHLLIKDGFLHKSVDLDMSDLRSGSVMYTSVTDDVTVRLEVVSAESVTLANEPARMVAGLLPSPSDHLVQTIGGSPDARVHPEKVISLASAPTPGIGDSGREVTSVGSSIVSSLPAKATIPLTMSPSATAIGHEIVNLEAPVTPPNPAVTLRGTDTFAPPSLPPAPPELDPNANGSNLNLPSSARPVSQSAEAERGDKVRPAKLIARRDLFTWSLQKCPAGWGPLNWRPTSMRAERLRM